MKKVKKEVRLELDSIDCEPVVLCRGMVEKSKLSYCFSTHDFISNPETLTHFVEVDEPETIREFCDMNGIPKQELVKWLNKNFNK